MQEATSMPLQSIAVLPLFKETPITNAQLHRLNRITSPAAPRWTRRRLLVTNAAPNRQEPSKELRLDQQDLMVIEFGRLLGESKEKTISKVLRRKIDPGSSYIELEKQAKAGNELVNKADFVLKVDRPGGGSRNGSMSGSDTPHLASPASRPNGSHTGLPKIGATADTQEILDDSLLRKPVSSQRSKTVLPIMSSSSLATNNVKRPDSQRIAALEQHSVDLNMLRRPSLDKEQDDGNAPPNPGNELMESSSSSLSKSFIRSPSPSLQPEVVKLPEDSDSIQASKLEFQRLLHKASTTSPNNVASPPVRQSHLSRESTTQDVSSLVDLAAALPNLVPPPSRHRGSIDTSVQPAQARTKAAVPSIKNSINEVLDDSLRRKPGVPASDDVTMSSAQSKISQDDDSLMLLKANVQPVLEGASAMPQLAGPPSRHTGTIGTFVQPSRAKIRRTQSRSKEPLDKSIEESLIRKPSIVERATPSKDSTPAAQASTAQLSINKDMQGKEETLADKQPSRPQLESCDTQNDDNRGYQIDALEQDVGEKTSQMTLQSEVSLLRENFTLHDTPRSDFESTLQVSDGSKVGNEALLSAPVQQSEPVLKGKSFAQTHEVLADPTTFNGSVNLREDGNGLDSVAESGELKEVDSSFGGKSLKVAALKKPVRILSSELEKGFASEGKTIPDSLQGPFLSPDSVQQAATGNLDIQKDLETGREVEESVSRLDRSNGELSLQPDQGSPKDRERVQMVQEQFGSASVTKHITVPLDGTSTFASVSADKETQRDCPLLQPIKMLRKPSQLPDAEFSKQCSEDLDLLSSNPKLHQAKEEEEKDWTRAEALLKEKEQVEVKLIGSNSAGLFVSFGCLVGFLPSFELSAKRGLVDFGTWAQQKGHDLSQRKAVTGAYDDGQSSTVTPNVEEGKGTTTVEGGLNELREKYKEEISKLLPSFVGEKTKVIVKLLDRGRRKLRVSEKEADPGCREHLQKKANLMAELKLGDVVICQVKSITPIGVFVEVDGVPALIHHSEVSWNTRVDPASLLSIGEVIKAKVCRLDRTLQRINLSLKQMKLDPLKRTLESVVGDLDVDSPMHKIEANDFLEMDSPELGDLLRKLERMDHVSSVSRGRCLYSAAFAPSFQVLISTPQSNSYKLLARFENKIQEILVQTTLDRDKMKECIRLCTFSEA